MEGGKCLATMMCHVCLHELVVHIISVRFCEFLPYVTILNYLPPPYFILFYKTGNVCAVSKSISI